MLIYESVGPTTSGNHLVIYITPGCEIPTVVCLCRTAEQATIEAARLNDHQAKREAAMQQRIANKQLYEIVNRGAVH